MDGGAVSVEAVISLAPVWSCHPMDGGAVSVEAGEESEGAVTVATLVGAVQPEPTFLLSTARLIVGVCLIPGQDRQAGSWCLGDKQRKLNVN